MTEHDQAADAEVVTPEDSQHTPAVAEDVLPDTLHLIPVPHRPFSRGRCNLSLSTSKNGAARSRPCRSRARR